MIRNSLSFLFAIPLIVFFAHFTTHYMQYFDIGINDSTRFVDIYWIRTPIAVIVEVVAVYLGNNFLGNIGGRVTFNFMLMLVALCLVFLGFALFDSGIVREGGFLRFLGYYFLNLPPGQIPKGT